MTDHRIARLRAAAFLFADPVKAHAWDNKFELLRACVRERKTAMVPRTLDTREYLGWACGSVSSMCSTSSVNASNSRTDCNSDSSGERAAVTR
jgi:hypothetical protein